MPQYRVITDRLLGHYDPDTSDPTGRHRFKPGDIISCELEDGAVPGVKVWDDTLEEFVYQPRTDSKGRPTSDLVPGTVVKQKRRGQWNGLQPYGLIELIPDKKPKPKPKTTRKKATDG